MAPKSIQKLTDLKKMTNEELVSLACECRKNIIKNVSINGGHLSSNLGVVEATIMLCKVFNFPKDKIIFDVGHQSYTYKLLTGRSLERLRKEDGVSGFPSIAESPFDSYGTGHSSTSISAAYGFAKARDLSNDDYEVISFIGDASLVNGLSFEGLNLLGYSNHKVIIVLNDNDMAISKPVGVVSDILKESAASKLFKDLGYNIVGPIDGHDYVSLEKAFNIAKESKESIVVHIKTVKGKGYKYAEEDARGDWHGVGPFDIETGEFKIDKNDKTWSDIYSNILFKNMMENKNIISIVPATGFGSSLKPIFDCFPERTIDVGIAEEHAVTMAASLAISGFRPVISMYSTFLQRTYDQIIHEVARQNAGVTFLIDRAGLVGGDGETHQGIYDEAFLFSIPNTVITMASSLEEANELFKESIKHNKPFLIRYPKEKYLVSEEKTKHSSFGKWKYVLRNDNKKVILTFGPCINELKTSIVKQSKKADLVNALYQNPIDLTMLNDISKNYDEIIIYNPYATKDGFSKTVIYHLNEMEHKGKIIDKSLPTTFFPSKDTSKTLNDLRMSINDVLDLI